MKTRLRTAAIIASLTFIVSTAAFAQYEPTNKSVVGLGMSLFHPLDSDLSDVASDWLSPSIEYNMRFDEKDRPTRVLSLTWFGEDGGNVKAKFVPLTYTYIKRHSKNGEDTGWYTGFGLGVAKVRIEANNFMTGWLSESSTNLGITLLAGYEPSDSVYAELRYTNFGSVTNTNTGKVGFDGLMLTVGTRVAY